MTANVAPIYSLVPDLQTNGTTGMSALVTTGVNDYVGGSATLVFTAGANGSFVQRLRLKAGGSTGGATVARFFINNGSTPGTTTNNLFYGEISLPIITASATVATVDIDYPMNFALPAGFRIYFQIATTVTAGWNCTAIGGDY